jgi:hypothetical protein
MQGKGLVYFFKTRLKKIGQRRWNCPHDSQIAAYADHQLAGPAKDRVEAHLADCDFCRDQVGYLIRSANASLPEPPPDSLLQRAKKLGEQRPRAEGRAFWHWGKIAAATACLVVIGTIALRNKSAGPTTAPANHPMAFPTQTPPQIVPPAPGAITPQPTVRSGHKTVLEPALVFPTAGAMVPENEIDFRWEPVAGALDYEVKLLTEEGDMVWTDISSASSLRLPADVKLEAGRKYFVQVRANLAEGKSAQSAPIAFTVTHH